MCMLCDYKVVIPPESCSKVFSAAGKPRHPCGNCSTMIIDQRHVVYFVFHFDMILFSVNSRVKYDESYNIKSIQCGSKQKVRRAVAVKPRWFGCIIMEGVSVGAGRMFYSAGSFSLPNLNT